MAKTGYISILAGIISIVGYITYIILTALETPLLLKVSIILIMFGFLIIIFKHISDFEQLTTEVARFLGRKT